LSRLALELTASGGRDRLRVWDEGRGEVLIEILNPDTTRDASTGLWETRFLFDRDQLTRVIVALDTLGVVDVAAAARLIAEAQG